MQASLQVNVELGRTSDAREHPAGRRSRLQEVCQEAKNTVFQQVSFSFKQHLRRSLAERLREGWQRKFLPVTTSILLPHGFAFVIAQFLIRRHRNKKAECFTDPQEDAPRSLPYIAGRVGPMWLIHALSVFVYAVSAPSAARILVTAPHASCDMFSLYVCIIAWFLLCLRVP